MSDDPRDKPPSLKSFAVIQGIANLIARQIAPNASQYCSFCEEAKDGTFKARDGATICRACVDHFSKSFAERKKVEL